MRNLIVFVVLGAVSLLLRNSEAVTYEVGDSIGWIRPSSSSVYSDWASDKTFAIGDTLTFTFTTGAHDVATVSKSNYDNCNGTSPNNSEKTGPAKITLNTAGDHYFICTVGDHCSVGQKLLINITAGSTPSPSGTPSSPPPPPPSPSAASSLAATSALVFMSIAISFMYFF